MLKKRQGLFGQDLYVFKHKLDLRPLQIESDVFVINYWEQEVDEELSLSYTEVIVALIRDKDFYDFIGKGHLV